MQWAEVEEEGGGNDAEEAMLAAAIAMSRAEAGLEEDPRRYRRRHERRPRMPMAPEGTVTMSLLMPHAHRRRR